MNYYNPIEQPARVRFVNRAIQEKINIYLNDQEIIRGLNYQQTTQYIPLPSGMYNIKIYTASNNLLLNENINISGSKLITFSQNQMGNFEVQTTDDIAMPQMMPYNPVQGQQQTLMRDSQSAGRSRIRFAHFSPNLPPVDITLPNGNVLFRNIDYRSITDYVSIAPGSYNLQARMSGNNQVLFSIPEFVIAPNDVKTIYAIGLLNSSPLLETVIVSERLDD